MSFNGLKDSEIERLQSWTRQSSFLDVRKGIQMKIVCRLTFDADLEGTIPDTGVMGLVNPDAILQKASHLVNPMLHKALTTALAQLSLIGVTVKIVKSSANFVIDPKD